VFRHLQTDEEIEAGLPLRRSFARLVRTAATDVRLAHDLGRVGRFKRMYLVFRYYLGFVALPLRSPKTTELRVLPRRVPAGGEIVVNVRRSQSDLFVFQNVMLHEFYSFDFAAHLGVVTVVVDLGANTGQSAAYFNAHFPAALFLCVEPVAESVRVLSMNASGRNWIVEQAAIGAIDGEVELGLSGWWGSASVVPHVWTARQRRRNRFESRLRLENRIVPRISMNTLLEKHGLHNVDVVKIDIEGAEYELFGSHLEWLDRVRCVVIEFHSKYVEAENIRQRLRDSGFDQIGVRPCEVFVSMKKNNPSPLSRTESPAHVDT
jgi:FkbM family methyltransferase